MKLLFHKYHGTGNDFILVDNREGNIHLSSEDIAWLCNRHLGIGADGLMFLTSEAVYDFGMKYFNSDGNESTMCGNGGRCVTAFARSLGLIEKYARFIAVDGEHQSEILKTEGTAGWIRLKMMDIAKSKIEHHTSKIIINTGSPHLVVLRDRVRETDVVAEGRKLRFDPQFAPDGINVDFVEVRDNGLFVRTYERGVENETLSCGTGVTAAALAVAHEYAGAGGSSVTSGIQHPASAINIETPGGLLKVRFTQTEASFTNIWLEGPAEFVFKGEINVRKPKPSTNDQ
jgi:diaminopimelate epimerase